MGSLDGEHSAEVDAPIEAVFACLRDLDRVSEWQPAVKEFTCLEVDAAGHPSRILTVLDTPMKRVTAELEVVYTQPTGMTWTLARGDVRGFDGSWTLTDLGGERTLVEYAVVIDLGRLGLFVRGPAAAAGRAALSTMPRRLKAFAEGVDAGLDRG